MVKAIYEKLTKLKDEALKHKPKPKRFIDPVKGTSLICGNDPKYQASLRKCLHPEHHEDSAGKK
jgi:hypothetical protein